MVHIENVLEFWLDSKRYFGGDYYAYRRAPLVLRLDPGDHILNVRLVRDVRLFGGENPPGLSVSFEAEFPSADILVDSAHAVFPDIVDEKAAGNYFSVSLTNTSEDAAYIQGVEVISNSGHQLQQVCISPCNLRDRLSDHRMADRALLAMLHVSSL